MFILGLCLTVSSLPFDDAALAGLLCSRLCHDMAGAVGATASGAELLEDGYDAETARLVAESAAGAVARLKFFRVALGAAGGDQASSMVRDLASGYLRVAASGGGGDLVLHWDCALARLDGETARLVLNLVLIARDALPRGGDITVTVSLRIPGEGAGLSVAYQGRGAGLGDEIEDSLVVGKSPLGPRGAQAWFTRCLVDKIGGILRVDKDSIGGRINV